MATDYLKLYEGAFLLNDYDKYTSEEDPVYKAPADFLKANIGKFKTHVDVSSGRGFLFVFLKDLDLCSTTTDLKQFNGLSIPFIKIDLTNKDDLNTLKSTKYDVLTCTGVLEHVEKEDVDSILKTFSETAPVCLLTIAKHRDTYDGVELHKIIEDEHWWANHIIKYFDIENLELFYEDGKLFYFELKSKIGDIS